MFDWKKPTVLMLGRWQPWHSGHQALFKRCIIKTGQVKFHFSKNTAPTILESDAVKNSIFLIMQMRA